MQKIYKPSKHDWLNIAIITLVYVLAQRASYIFPGVTNTMMAVWPPAGIGLAAFLLNPKRLWPYIAIVIYIIGSISNITFGQPLLASMGFMLANVTESLGCAYFINLRCGANIRFEKVKEFISLIVAATLINASTACIGAGIATIFSNGYFASNWITWWIADGLGILIVTPFVVSLLVSISNYPTILKKRTVESIILIALICFASWFCFQNNWFESSFSVRPYLLFGLFAVLALRFNMLTLSFSLLISTSIIIASNEWQPGFSILGGEDIHEQILYIQLFIAILSVTGYLISTIVNERKLANEALDKIERNYALLFNNTNEGIFIGKPDGSIKIANPAACNMLGYTEEEITQIGRKGIYDPEDDQWSVALQERIKTGSFKGELNYIKKDGTKISTETLSTIFHDRNNEEFTGIFIRDISLKKQLEASENKYSKLFHQTIDGVSVNKIIFDKNNNPADYVTLEVNKAFENILHVDINNVVGKKASEFMSAEELQKWLAIFAPVAINGGNCLYENFSPANNLYFEGNVFSPEKNTFAVVFRDVSSRKIAERELIASEEKYRSLIQTSLDGYWRVDLNGNLLEVNQAYCAMSGYTEQELYQMSIADIEISENPQDVSHHIRKIMQLGSDRFETKNRRKDGTSFNAELSVQFRSNHEEYFVVFIRDISERKQAELVLRKSQEQLLAAERMALLGHWEYDVTTDTFTFNDNFYAIFKTTAEKVGGYLMSSAQYAKLFVHPDEMHQVEFETRKALETTNPYYSSRLEHRIIFANGEIGTISVTIFIVKDDQGKTIKTYGVNQDITARKDAENAIRENELQLQSLFDTMSEGVALNEIILDSNNEMVDYRILKVNSAFYTSADYVGDKVEGNVATQLYGMSAEFIKSFWHQHHFQKQTVTTEYISPLKNRCYIISTSPFINNKFVTTFIDISDRKKIEQSLIEAKEKIEESEKIARSLLNSSNDLAILIDTSNNTILDINEVTVRNLGKPVEEFIGKPIFEVLPEDKLKTRITKYLNAVSSGMKAEFEDERNGRFYYNRYNPISDPSGKIIRMAVFSIDITRRKEIELEIIKAKQIAEENEAKFKAIFDNSQDAIGVSKAGINVFFNQSYIKLFGYQSEEELVGKSLLTQIAPSEHPRIKENIRKRAVGEPVPTYYETIGITKDGKEFPFEMTVGNFMLNNEKYTIGIIRDITERKLTQEKLLEKTALLEAHLNTAIDGILIVDHNGKKVLQNQQTVKLWNIPEHIVNNSDDQQQIDHVMNFTKNPETFVNKIKYLYSHPEETSYDEIELVNNTILERYSAPVIGINNRNYGRIWVFRDITKRKLAENALKENERFIRNITDNVPAYIASVDAKTLKYTFVNQSFVSGFKKGKNEIVGAHISEVIGKENTEFAMQYINEVLNGKPSSYINTFNLVNGKRHINVNYVPDFDESGNVKNIIVISYDVSDIINKDIALKASEEKFRRSFENAAFAIALVNTNFQFISVNHALCNMLGYTEKEMLHRTFSDITHPEDKKIGIELTKELYEGKRDYFWLEKRYVHKNGSIVWGLLSSSMVRDSENKPIFTIAQIQDITARKIAEAELKQSEQMYSTIFNESPIALEFYNSDGLLVNVNNVCLDTFGILDKDEIKNWNLFNDPNVTTEQKECLARGETISYKVDFDFDIIKQLKLYRTSKSGKRKFDVIISHVGIGFIAQIVDITERDKAEFELRKSREELKNAYNKLLISETNLKLAQKVAHLGSWEWDIKQGNLSWSDEMYQIFGIQKESFSGKLSEVIANAIHPDDRDAVDTSNVSVMLDKKPIPLEYRILHADGSMRYVWAEAGQLIEDQQGNPEFLRGIVLDITNRKKIELELLESERRFKYLAEASEEGIGFSENGIILDCNERMNHLFLCPRESMIGQSIINFIAPETREKVFAYLTKPIDGLFELWGLKTDGTKFPIEIKSGMVDYYGRKVMVAVIRDLTFQKDMENKILTAIIEAEERERDRISHELHDGLGPLLSTIKLYFQWLIEDPAKEKITMLAKKGNHNMEEAIHLVREISHNLSPRVLNNFGFITALRNHIDMINSAGKIKYVLQSNTDARFMRNVEYSLYRIAGELINNTLKHSKAKNGGITLAYDNLQKALRFSYFDDGKGFDVDKALNEGQGLGLKNIYQRLKTIEATMKIESSKGKGTGVYIELPVNEV
jgi:PAS domain S-box-containing protein